MSGAYARAMKASEWLDAYASAWERADAAGVVDLFTPGATYRSHVFRQPHAGHHGIREYWESATATQREVHVRIGDALVDGDRVVAEWWTTMTEEEGPVTLPGVLLLDFDGDRCTALREYWALEPGRHEPFPGWGRFAGGAGAPEHARAWAADYGRAWAAGDAGAAAETFSETAVYRTHPFRDPHRGRSEVHAYTAKAYASEEARRVRMAPFAAAGNGAAIEYWATYSEAGSVQTLAGCTLVAFDDTGRVAEGRDYWHVEEGARDPHEGGPL